MGKRRAARHVAPLMWFSELFFPGVGAGGFPIFCGRMVKVDAARSERWGFAVLTRVEFGEGPTAVTCWMQ